MCFTFDAYLVAGFTPVIINGPHDVTVNRPDGMEGYIINITTNGSAWVENEEGEKFRVEKNDMLIFPPRAIHHYARHEEDECWEHYWIYFMPRPYWSEWLHWNGSDSKIEKITLADEAESETIKKLFNEVITWFSEKNYLSEAMAMNKLEHIILTCHKRQHNYLNKIKDPRVTELCSYLNNTLSQDEPIAQLAKRVNISPSRLSHIFRRDTGMTISEWKENQRIYCARNMLQNTSLTVSEVARLSGYNDAFYFSKIFSRNCGMSPSAYRKNYLKTAIAATSYSSS